MRKNTDYQQGQVLLIIVLVMIVALTIGLSVVTRSITNLQISTEEENSQRALSAAEAGIEKALSSDGATNFAGDDLGNNSKISNVNIDQVGGTQFLVNNGNPLLKDDGADIWLSTYSSNPDNSYGDPKYVGAMRVYWGSQGESCNGANKPAALEILIISGSKANPTVRHYPVDPCNDRQNDNNFCTLTNPPGRTECQNIAVRAENGTGTLLGKNFRYSVRIGGINQGLLARVMPLYTATPLAVTNDSGGSIFPNQGSVIESVGESGNTERKITVYRGFPRIPVEFFPYVLFSP